MKFDLIFYLAKKTNFCEIKLKRILEDYNTTSNTIFAATTPIELGACLTQSLDRCYLVFIIGGLSTGEPQAFQNVISRAIANSGSGVTAAKKLRSKSGACDGYLISSGKQMIVALPDEPSEIEYMLSEKVLQYIIEVVV